MRVFAWLVAIVLIVVTAAAFWGWQDFRSEIDGSIRTDEPVAFTIERGWSARRVSRELAAAGLIERPHWFDLQARLSEKAQSIKTGEYVLQPGTRVGELLDVFSAGKTVQYPHTIIEGSTFRELLDRLATAARLQHTIAPGDTQSQGKAIMNELGFPDLHPEGQFFADTYRFPSDTSDIEFLGRAKRLLDRVLAEEWEARADGLPLKTPHEALVLASIVEKETALASERPLIAGVFLSRIDKKMRLQTDPTVIYGIGESFDGNIRRSDLTTDTPYNTYTRGGLPPTPIAMVGREAIHAVMHPDETASLYFVSRGDGSHQFSVTLADHEAAVRKYQLNR